ncbi:MAG TPA: hypothetical protein VLZ05_04920 [Mycobacterium sp.]|nr:hypothetical protein [Mycobacterium sp.]HUH68268.1 hypothetical protein [Mycobacterium sp.]
MKPEWKAYEYSYRIHWSPGERGYVAYVAEFPTMQSPPGATPHAALDALMTTVVEKLHQLDVEGKPRPPALAQSGLSR